MTRYQHLARLLAQRINQGLYVCGERLPSVRALSKEHGVSISTVQQAYYLLEEQRLITPQPRSGYFVTPHKSAHPMPALTRPPQHPVDVTQWEAVLEQMNMRQQPGIMQFGDCTPDLTQPTLKPLWKIISRIGQQQDIRLLRYEHFYGAPELREQVARLAVDSGCHLTPEEIVATNGCHEALSIAIRAVCQAGDIVAVESPGYHGILQILHGLNVKVIEIPTDSQTGISLEALELALDQWPVKAVIVVPNCNNPLGFIMPERRKRALLALAQRFDIAIIEDDVYGELAWEYPRPPAIKAFDSDGRVLLCSSFSKTLGPGLRVGWVVPGRYLDRVLHMKYIVTGASVQQTQLAAAEFVRQGFYPAHLRRMRQCYQRNLDAFTAAVLQHFPCGICVTRPQGGYLLWIELPEAVDTAWLNKQMHENQIQIAAGALLSASGKYRNCLRLNYGMPFTAEVEKALVKMGTAAGEYLPALTVR